MLLSFRIVGNPEVILVPVPSEGNSKHRFPIARDAGPNHSAIPAGVESFDTACHLLLEPNLDPTKSTRRLARKLESPGVLRTLKVERDFWAHQ